MLVGDVDKRDKRVVFDEDSHTYYVDGIPMPCSATKLVHKYFPAFDGPAIAKKMVEDSEFLNRKDRQQYHALVADCDLNTKKGIAKATKLINNKWTTDGKAASDAGTVMHKTIEKYYREGVELPSDKEYTMFLSFNASVRSKGYLPFRCEQVVWDLDLMLAGSADMLYIHESNVHLIGGQEKIPVWLADWKRSKEIKTSGYATGFGPLKCKRDCNYEHYSLQLNIYKHLMEKHYNLLIEEMTLVILHPNQNDVLEFDVKPMESIVSTIMNTLSKENIAKKVESSSEDDEPIIRRKVYSQVSYKRTD